MLDDIQRETQYLAIFDALCDRTRMEIVRLIANADELPCTTLARILPISKSTISYHIKILGHAQLISVRKQGRYYHYRLRNDVFEEYIPKFVERLPGVRQAHRPGLTPADATVAERRSVAVGRPLLPPT